MPKTNEIEPEYPDNFIEEPGSDTDEVTEESDKGPDEVIEEPGSDTDERGWLWRTLDTVIYKEKDPVPSNRLIY